MQDLSGNLTVRTFVYVLRANYLQFCHQTNAIPVKDQSVSQARYGTAVPLK